MQTSRNRPWLTVAYDKGMGARNKELRTNVASEGSEILVFVLTAFQYLVKVRSSR